jgi:hypothetical protein
MVMIVFGHGTARSRSELGAASLLDPMQPAAASAIKARAARRRIALRRSTGRTSSQPGQRLVAITNGRDHLAELWQVVQDEDFETRFSGENGGTQLERQFARVAKHEVHTSAVFPDRAAAVAYLETLAPGRNDLANRLPDFSTPLVVRGAPVVFVADK